jgi:hypothetical protein
MLECFICLYPYSKIGRLTSATSYSPRYNLAGWNLIARSPWSTMPNSMFFPSAHFLAGQPAISEFLNSVISFSWTGKCGQARRANKAHASGAAYSDPKIRPKFSKCSERPCIVLEHVIISSGKTCFFSGAESEPVQVLDTRRGQSNYVSEVSEVHHLHQK